MPALDDPGRTARVMWTHVEPLHAITYFHPRARAAYEAIGLRGYWRGYFAGRAARWRPVARPGDRGLLHLRPADGEPGAAGGVAVGRPTRRRCVPGSPGPCRRSRNSPTSCPRRTWPRRPSCWRRRPRGGDRRPGARRGQRRPAPGRIPVGPALAGGHHAARAPGRRARGRAGRRRPRPGGDAGLPGGRGHAGGAPARPGLDGGAVERGPGPAGRPGLADRRRRAHRAGRAGFQAVEDATDRAATRPWRALGPDRTERLRELLVPVARACHTLIPADSPIGLPALRP